MSEPAEDYEIEEEPPETEEPPEEPPESEEEDLGLLRQHATAFRQIAWGARVNPQAKEHFDELVQILDGNAPVEPPPDDDDPDIAALKRQVEQMDARQRAGEAAQGEAIYAGWVADFEDKYGALDDQLKGEVRRRADAGWLGPLAYQHSRATGENPLLGLIYQIAPDRITGIERDRAARAGAAIAKKASSPAPRGSEAPRTEKAPEDMTGDELTELMLATFREHKEGQGAL